MMTMTRRLSQTSHAPELVQQSICHPQQLPLRVLLEVGSQSQLRRSGSSVLRKSYTSDDELDELNSPLASIFIDSSRSSPVATKPSWVSKRNGNQTSVRYELLREVWMNSE
ncbi:hypothetical protein ACFX2I_044765 [Malus domestica]